MAYVLTAWPTTANVIAYASAMAPNLATRFAAVNTDLLTLLINSSAAQVEQKTGKQFVAVSETRYYDGSGTGVQIVDDYISIDIDSNDQYEVWLYAVPGQTSGFLQLSWVQEVSEPGRAKNAIQIYQGPAIASYIYYTYFPQGRSNLKINASWGYASTIPDDIFELVMADVTDKLINGTQVSEAGVVLGATDGDGSYRFGESPWWKVSGWNDRANQIIGSYKRDIISNVSRRRIPQY